MTVLYFGSEDPSSPSDQMFLKPELYQKVSAPDAVYEYVRKKLKKPSTPRLQSNEDEGSGGAGSSTQQGGSHEDGRHPPPQRQPPQPTGTERKTVGGC